MFRWESAVSSFPAAPAYTNAFVAVVRAPATGLDTPPVTTSHIDESEAVPAS